MTTQASSARPEVAIPEIIVNPKNGRKFKRGKFLGKGGFAKCFELTALDTNEILAGKIVPKNLLQKEHQKEKMQQEIDIHRTLAHRNVVQFHDDFQDHDFQYVILELCRRRSLMELHKRRRTVTEIEAKYFLKQICEGVLYLHEARVIHRDLKLGNLFLNDDLEVKIGDFGLASRLDYQDQIRRTLCGTPNYIAPEVLRKTGHTFPVDSWSIGCILYTLLVGRPPFETSNLKDTYRKIKDCDYNLPTNRLSPHSCKLIRKLLSMQADVRPTMKIILNDDFLRGYIPSRLPLSCLTMAPRFDLNQSYIQVSATGGRGEPNDHAPQQRLADAAVGFDPSRKPLTPLNPPNVGLPAAVNYGPPVAEMLAQQQEAAAPADCWLPLLYEQVASVVNCKIRGAQGEDYAEDPAAIPIYWIAKWVDYSDKYGLGYQLNDNSVGVLFNDYTRLVLLANGDNMHYIERDGEEKYHQLAAFPRELSKKVTLLKYFKNYMNEHLITAGANIEQRESDAMSRLPYLRNWFRTKTAIVMHLNNGTLQINFFEDHVKLFLCPLMGAVTFINEQREYRVFQLNKLAARGCSDSLHSRLDFAKKIIVKLINSKSTMSNRVVKSGQHTGPTPNN